PAGWPAVVLDRGQAATALAGQTGTVPGSRLGACCLQPSARLERQPWMGLVSVPGRQGRRRASAQARLPGNGHAGASRISLSLDLDTAVLAHGPGGEKLESPRERARTPG